MNASTLPRRIDVHRHAMPADLIAEAVKMPGWQGATEGNISSFYAKWTPEGALEDMDKYDIASTVLCMSTSFAYPGMWLAKLESRRHLARIQNEYMANLARDRPSRFGTFATLPLPDIEGSLAEIEYALDTLKADGFMIPTNQDGRYPSDPAFAPILDELNRRRAVVLVHPKVPVACNELMPHANRLVIEGPVDTTRAIANLVFTGTLARFPDIRYIFCHGGGTVPILIQRLERAGNYNPAVAEYMPNGFRAEMRKLWFDILNMTNPVAAPCLLAFMESDRLLFGTDHPSVRTSATHDGLPSMNLAEADLKAIECDNAMALFPRWRR